MDDHESLPLFEDMCRQLEAIRAVFRCEDRQLHFREYGLKPASAAMGVESALHMTRLESLQGTVPGRAAEKLLWGLKPHWIIVDNAKFPALIGKLRVQIDALIDSTGVERHVNLAMKRDIRALGWHPLFDRIKAASDGSEAAADQGSLSGRVP